MTQYTIEHPTKTDSLYSSGNIYVHVEDHEVEAVMALSRYGVVVRPSTEEEIKHVWGLEVELDYGDPDVARDWEEDEGCIVLEIKDW